MKDDIQAILDVLGQSPCPRGALVQGHPKTWGQGPRCQKCNGPRRGDTYGSRCEDCWADAQGDQLPPVSYLVRLRRQADARKRMEIALETHSYHRGPWDLEVLERVWAKRPERPLIQVVSVGLLPGNQDRVVPGVEGPRLDKYRRKYDRQVQRARAKKAQETQDLP